MGVSEDRIRRASRKVKRLEYITYRKHEITRILTEESTEHIEALLREYDNLQYEEIRLEIGLKKEFKTNSVAEIINILRKKNHGENKS